MILYVFQSGAHPLCGSFIRVRSYPLRCHDPLRRRHHLLRRRLRRRLVTKLPNISKSNIEIPFFQTQSEPYSMEIFYRLLVWCVRDPGQRVNIIYTNAVTGLRGPLEPLKRGLVVDYFQRSSDQSIAA